MISSQKTKLLNQELISLMQKAHQKNDEKQYTVTPEKIAVFIQKGADVNVRGVRNFTPLILAAYYQRPPLALVLLKAGADVNALDVFGNNALMVYLESATAQCISVPFTRGLLNAGINSEQKNNKGENALDILYRKFSLQDPAIKIIEGLLVPKIEKISPPASSPPETKTLLQLEMAKRRNALKGEKSNKVKSKSRESQPICSPSLKEEKKEQPVENYPSKAPADFLAAIQTGVKLNKTVKPVIRNHETTKKRNPLEEILDKSIPKNMPQKIVNQEESYDEEWDEPPKERKKQHFKQ